MGIKDGKTCEVILDFVDLLIDKFFTKKYAVSLGHRFGARYDDLLEIEIDARVEEKTKTHE